DFAVDFDFDFAFDFALPRAGDFAVFRAFDLARVDVDFDLLFALAMRSSFPSPCTVRASSMRAIGMRLQPRCSVGPCVPTGKGTFGRKDDRIHVARASMITGNARVTRQQ